ncbi:hypothetical protein GGD92_22425 [Pseudomonas protegens]|uniref:Uncharacterized protein n=1 Tax=Pseudomonas protegens TaxID=380021 RepID=A0A7G7X574_9PSED|nr:hypothetical protein [Pseudomonas protegens]QNH75119.1 hypothetical protein GGI48_17500 [Pseudomonas protegens]QNL04313.1 hypothetical protein GGD92_22425 [Pseudomonas protegens]
MAERLIYWFFISVLGLAGAGAVGFFLYKAWVAFQWSDQAYWGFVVLALGVGLFTFINTKKLYGTWMGPSSTPAEGEDKTAG